MSMVCPSWLSFILYNPLRLRFTDRKKILDESHITPDSVVLEVGAGTGFLTELIAQAAKKAVCIELQYGMTRKLEKRVGKFGDKIEIINADIASYIPENAFADVCLLYYSFHEVSNKRRAAENITRSVKSRGFLSIYEPSIEVSGRDMQETVELFEQNGFKKEDEHKNIFTRFAILRKIA